MTRDEIIMLIQEHYDPAPKGWPARHRGWDDGSGYIADTILSKMQPIRPASALPLKERET